MSTLVISNAATPRARRFVPALRDALPESSWGRHQVGEDGAALAALLGHDRWLADDLLVINGGDGSVQHALTLLFAHCPAPRLPRIACLPGGSTNMTAFDINRHRRLPDCLVTLRRLGTAPGSVADAPRPVVRVTDSAAAPAQHAQCGLFFGMGTIVQGVEYFRERLRERLSGAGGHELAAGAALARTVWGIARRQRPFDETVRARVEGPPLWPAAASLSLRLLLATTLDRLFLGIRPYWGAGAGPIKVTAVERRAEAFLGRLPRVLRGRPDERMTAVHGYHSGRAGALELTFAGSYTLDGELFRSAGDSMRLRATDAVRFVPL